MYHSNERIILPFLKNAHNVIQFQVKQKKKGYILVLPHNNKNLKLEFSE